MPTHTHRHSLKDILKVLIKLHARGLACGRHMWILVPRYYLFPFTYKFVLMSGGTAPRIGSSALDNLFRHGGHQAQHFRYANAILGDTKV